MLKLRYCVFIKWRNGFGGVILWSARFPKQQQAIEQSTKNEQLLYILEAINNGSTYFEKDGTYIEELTETEKQVLLLLAGGTKRKEIAEQLFMSERTVSNHLQHIFEKLGVSSAVEAITKSIQLGYIPPL